MSTTSNFFRPKRPSKDATVIDDNSRDQKKTRLGPSQKEDHPNNASNLNHRRDDPTNATKDDPNIVDLCAAETPSPSSTKNTETDAAPVVDGSIQEGPSSSSARTNPFAMFAHPSSLSRASTKRNKSTSLIRQFQAKYMSDRQKGDKESLSSNHKIHDIKKQKETNSVNKPEKALKKKNEFVRMRELSVDEQERITVKWLSLADLEPPNQQDVSQGHSLDDFIELRRFQVLVAARLHARCQEGSVRKALHSLRTYFQQKNDRIKNNDEDSNDDGDDDHDRSQEHDAMDSSLNGTLSVENVASAYPEDIAKKCLTNLQYYNMKSHDLVKAANEIQLQHRGKVPEDEHSLLRITGIGKVFADLLAFVNTKEQHVKYINEHVRKDSE